MRIGTYQNGLNRNLKKNVSSAIFVNSKKSQSRKLQRINHQRQLEKNLELKPTGVRKAKMGVNQLKNRIFSVMAGILIIFLLVFSLIWVVTK